MLGATGAEYRNLIEDGSCQSQFTGDAQLEESGEDAAYARPLAASPLIDAAHPELCSDMDQIGQARPLGGGCDIGAIQSVPVVRTLSDCSVTTTHQLNFRAGPGGDRVGLVPARTTLAAAARTPGWFQVDYEGVAGWISADYVTETEGDCD